MADRTLGVAALSGPDWSLELPGYVYAGDNPDGFAHWREVLRVIADYAASTRAPVREHTDVTID